MPKNINVISYPHKLYNKVSLSNYYYHSKLIYKNRYDIDLVHCLYDSETVFQPYHISLIYCLLKIPYILRISGGQMYPARPHFMHQWLFNNAAGIVTVSTPMRQEYEKRHDKPITMIPSMLPFHKSNEEPDVLKRKYNLSPYEFVVLFIGRLVELKGTHILIQAFANLGVDYINKHKLRLVIAGDGPFKEELQKKSLENKLNEKITFLGWIPHEQVHELYKLAQIFVIPSYKEARPLTLTEAFFNGIPSIGSNIPTISNIIQDNYSGLLFKPGDPVDLSIKLRQLIENSSLRFQFGVEAVQQYKKMYRYETMLDDYLKFYDKAMSSNYK
jgi:glycosyltransferase involved in cell wall biosynthesis